MKRLRLDYINQNMFYLSDKVNPPSRSYKIRLNSSAEQLTQFQQKLRQVGLDLFSVVQTTISSGVC